MNNVRDFIQLNMNFLNDIQSYHWQTESFSEHEAQVNIMKSLVN